MIRNVKSTIKRLRGNGHGMGMFSLVLVLVVCFFVLVLQPFYTRIYFKSMVLEFYKDVLMRSLSLLSVHVGGVSLLCFDWLLHEMGDQGGMDGDGADGVMEWK